MDGPATIQGLPNELLDIILGYLESPAPADAWLKCSPSSGAVSSSDCQQPLKSASLVSKKWRDVANQHLFRRVVWRVDKTAVQGLETEIDRSGAISPLRFVRDNELVPYVDSFTMVVNDQPVQKSVPSDIILSDFAPEKRVTYDTDMNWLWATILEDIDPLRLTLVASPKTLAWLFSRMIFLADEWCFSASHHIVSLSRESRQTLEIVSRTGQDASDSGSDSTTTNSSAASSRTSVSSYMSRRPTRRTPCNLFTMKPWASVLLNEGSNSRVYKVYEYSLKRPPSILGALLGCEEHPNNTPLLPHSVRNLSYICDSPVSSHWNVVIRFLPRLDKFYFRVSAPTPPPSPFRPGHNAESNYAALRRNDLYLSLMRAAFGKRRANGNSSINWRYLQEIESGDQDNESCMYLMENNFVAQREKRGWAIVRPGFIRDETVPIPLPGEDDEGDAWSDSDSDWL
ncbi:F-box domain-containing protein [Zalerion maritima]|uniref:F-box domain-containing protein n=1 Tax=Zalerion maritima TaxID=339359 RepID=A0AAD5RG01_9PEZI|nr:F-box domain-containing protein [Zalerion maritima]